MDEGVGKSGSSHSSPPPPSAGSSRGTSSSASPGTMSRRGFPGGDLRQQAQQPPRPELPPAFSVPTANTTPHDTAITRVLDTHVYARLTAFFPGLPGSAGTRKVKPIWILLKQETVSGSGISWAVCKSAPRSRQITMPVPHHSSFHRPDALPAAQPTASKQRVLDTIREFKSCKS